MRREGDKLIFDAGEDVVYKDLHLSNKGGYEVELDLSDDDEVEGISVFRGGDSLDLGLADWCDLKLSLEDDDVFSTYDNMFDWRRASSDMWNHVE